MKVTVQDTGQHLRCGKPLGSGAIAGRGSADSHHRSHKPGSILFYLSILFLVGQLGIAHPLLAWAGTASTLSLTESPAALMSDFTVIGLPDTQYYSDGDPDIYMNQTQWIVDNRNNLNIVHVAHKGDIVQDPGAEEQWNNADEAMSLLESDTDFPDGIPYSVLPGNHDQPTVLYNQYFGVSRFQGRGYYGGSYDEDDNDNNYTLFSAEGMDFIVVSLEYNPDSDILEWADTVLKTYSDRRAIVVSHSLLDDEGDFTWYGQQTYEALRDNPNLFLMLAGHRPGEARRMDVHNGNTVHTLLANYQTRENGGNGWLRILTFSPANNQIQVQTYSPYLDQFERDADSEFTLDYAMNADLAISTSASSDPAVAGESLTYTLTISNNGPMDATNVTLTNTLPEDVAFASATPDQGTCVQAGSAVTCELSGLDAGDSAQVTIRGTVDAARRGVLINTAVVAGNELDATQANDLSFTETVVQAEADLSVIASVPSGPVVSGKSLAYALIVTNSGPSDATGVTLTDTLPADVAFVSATPDQGTCVQAEQIVTCELSNLDAGHAAQVTIWGMVDAARRGVLINTAAAAGSELDATPANDVSLTETAVQAEADLAASGHVSSESGAIGWNLTYTLTLTNHGPSDATQVTLTNTLSAGVAFVSATSDQGTCVQAERTVTCNADAVASGAHMAVVITVRPNVMGMMSHAATGASSEPDPDTSNNTIVKETVVYDRRIYLPIVSKKM